MNRTACLTLLVLTSALSACGDGGSGGVSSTPPPPTYTYTKVADMTGDRTFRTGGIQYTVGTTPNFTNAQTVAFGSGPQISYTAATDTYTLTDSSGHTATFTPLNVVQNPTAPPGQVQWQSTNGSTVERFALSVPSANGVPLSYAVIGNWSTTTVQNSGTVRLGFGGAPTQSGDMPRSGNATYSTGIGGALDQGGAYSLNANSTATFSANFASNTVSTSMTLVGVPSLLIGGGNVAFGTYTGTGTISGNAIAGTLTGGSMSGAFSGAFFGPQAAEFGSSWYLNGTIGGTSANAVGSIYGIKQ